MVKKLISLILGNDVKRLIFFCSKIYSSRPLIIYKGKALQYNQIIASAYNLSKEFSKLRSPIIAFWGNNCPAFLITRLAAHISNSTFLPLHSDFTLKDVTLICGQANVGELFTTTDGLCPIKANIELHKTKNYSFYLEDIKADILTYNLSSGTTSHIPKIVLHSSKAWMNSLYQFISTTSNKRALRFICMPSFATAGSITLLPLMLSGSSYIIPENAKIETVVKNIIDFDATDIYFTPHWFTKFLDYSRQNKISLPSLRRVIVGTEPLHPFFIQEFLNYFKIPLTTGYGMVEALPPLSTITFYPNSTYAKDELKTVGPPLKNVEVQIKEKKIWIKSPTLALKYLNNEKENNRFSNNGFQTADYGYIDKNQNIYILGRDIDLLDKQNFIFARDVEEKILDELRHLIKDLCCIKYNDYIYLFLVIRKKIKTKDQAKKIYNKVITISPIKEIKLIFLESIPVKATGKVNREALYEKIHLLNSSENFAL